MLLQHSMFSQALTAVWVQSLLRHSSSIADKWANNPTTVRLVYTGLARPAQSESIAPCQQHAMMFSRLLCGRQGTSTAGSGLMLAGTTAAVIAAGIPPIMPCSRLLVLHELVEAKRTANLSCVISKHLAAWRIVGTAAVHICKSGGVCHTQ
jgi:hypothetical protein